MMKTREGQGSLARRTFTSWMQDDGSRETLWVVAVYTAAWGLLLLASGRYWDDWAGFGLPMSVADAWARQQGLFWQQWLVILSWIPYTERIGHAIVFVAYLFCALAVHRLMQSLPGSTARSRVIVPAVFAVFPVNGARYAFADLSYAISLVVFMAAWWLLVADVERPKLTRRIVAAGMFLFAMLSTASLIVFIALVPLHLVWIQYSELREPRARKQLVARYGFLIALPVAAWILRSVFLQPSGLYAGYNHVGASGLLAGVSLLPSAFANSLVLPIADAFRGHLAVTAILGFLVYAALAVSFRPAIRGSDRGLSMPFAMLVAGALSFIAGVFPYVAVGKLPQLGGWESRHQLLVPLGAALLVVASIEFAGHLLRIGPSAELLVLCMLVSAFVLSDLRISVAYQRDWYKQVSLMSQMGHSQDIRRGSYFVMTDNTSRLNAAGRRYAAYELNGMMRQVFGDATRFAVDQAVYSSNDEKASALELMRKDQQYNCWQYKPTSEKFRMIVDPGATDVAKASVVAHLMWSELVDPDAFQRRVADVVTIRTVPLQGSSQ